MELTLASNAESRWKPDSVRCRFKTADLSKQQDLLCRDAPDPRALDEEAFRKCNCAQSVPFWTALSTVEYLLNPRGDCQHSQSSSRGHSHEKDMALKRASHIPEDHPVRVQSLIKLFENSSVSSTRKTVPTLRGYRKSSNEQVHTAVKTLASKFELDVHTSYVGSDTASNEQDRSPFLLTSQNADVEALTDSSASSDTMSSCSSIAITNRASRLSRKLNSGTPRVCSLAKDLAAFTNGKLDNGYLDISVDDGTDTPLTKGRRLIRFSMAAAKLEELFGTSSSDSSNHDTAFCKRQNMSSPSSRLNSTSGCERKQLWGDNEAKHGYPSTDPEAMENDVLDVGSSASESQSSSAILTGNGCPTKESRPPQLKLNVPGEFNDCSPAEMHGTERTDCKPGLFNIANLDDAGSPVTPMRRLFSASRSLIRNLRPKKTVSGTHDAMRSESQNSKRNRKSHHFQAEDHIPKVRRIEAVWPKLRDGFSNICALLQAKREHAQNPNHHERPDANVAVDNFLGARSVTVCERCAA